MSKTSRIWNEVVKNGIFHNFKIPNEPDETFKWTIYGDNIKYSEWKKRWHHIHSTVKYRIMIPAFKIFDIILGSHRIDAPRPHHWHDANLIAFDKAFKYALKRNIKDENLKKLIAMGKRWMTVFIVQDTAYRELFNMWLINTTIQINRIRHDVKKALLGGRDLISEAYETAWIEAKIDWIRYYLKANKKLTEQEVYDALKNCTGFKAAQALKNIAQSFMVKQEGGQKFMKELIMGIAREVDKANKHNSICHHLIYSSKGMLDRNYYAMGKAMMQEKLSIQKLTEDPTTTPMKQFSISNNKLQGKDVLASQNEELEKRFDKAMAENEEKRKKELAKRGIKPILCK